jgi:hypothetical protein
MRTTVFKKLKRLSKNAKLYTRMITNQMMKKEIAKEETEAEKFLVKSQDLLKRLEKVLMLMISIKKGLKKLN